MTSDTESSSRAEASVTDAPDLEIKKLELEIEGKRSRVRRWVTYWVIGGYLLLAACVVLWLMWAERYEVAIGVLGGVAGLAGSISGFWFGSRRPGSSPLEPGAGN